MHGDIPCSFILKIPKMIQNIDLDVYIHDTIFSNCFLIEVFPSHAHSKGSTCNVRYLGSIPGSERSSREGNGYPLQYSCQGNHMDRGAWWAIVSEVTKNQTRLSKEHFHYVVNLQCCVGFRYIANWWGYICIDPFSDSCPSWVFIRNWI